MDRITVILTEEEVVEAIGRFAATKSNRKDGFWTADLKFYGKLPAEIRVTLTEGVDGKTR